MVFHLVPIFYNIISFLLNSLQNIISFYLKYFVMLRRILEVTIENRISIGQYFFPDTFITYVHYKEELLRSILRRMCRIIKQYRIRILNSNITEQSPFLSILRTLRSPHVSLIILTV